MARVNVEPDAFGDERFGLLAMFAGFADAEHALGKMCRIWNQCTIENSYVLSPDQVNLILGKGGVEALIAARLGEKNEEGIRIKGTKGRVEWREKMRKNGKKGGRPKGGKKKPPGSGKGNPPSPSPAPAPSPIAESPPRRRSRAASGGDLGERDIKPENMHPELPLPPPAAAPPPPPPGPPLEPYAAKKAQILRAVAKAHAEAFNAIRAEFALPVPAMQLLGDPAEKALQQLLGTMSSLEDAEATCMHVLAVREDEARRDRSLKFFGASVWSAVPFGRAVAKAVGEEENRRPPAPAGPPRRGGGFAALLAAGAGDRGVAS